MDLDALRCFAQVAEQASFTRAAERLGLPKARVSAKVQALEAELGTRLLHRTTRRVRPTGDGELLLERCHVLLAEVDEVQALFQREPAALRGRLRLDLPHGMACRQVLPRLPEFLARHPGLEVSISTTDRRVDPVAEGIDCVLRVGTLGDSGLVARRIGLLPQLNCASPAYLARHGTPHSLDDLDRLHIVRYGAPPGPVFSAFEHVDAEGRLQRRPMQGLVTVDSTEAYQAACLAGLGLIQAPRIGNAHLLERGDMVEVLPAHRAPPLPVSLVYPHRRHLPRRVQAVMDWLAEVLTPLLARSAEIDAPAMAPCFPDPELPDAMAIDRFS